eukprot:4987755-Pyramimonas_sp.AAC.1
MSAQLDTGSAMVATAVVRSRMLRGRHAIRLMRASTSSILPRSRLVSVALCMVKSIPGHSILLP